MVQSAELVALAELHSLTHRRRRVRAGHISEVLLAWLRSLPVVFHAALSCRSMSRFTLLMRRDSSPTRVCTPRASISSTFAPRWICGSRSIPCSFKLRWSTRSSYPASSSARFVYSAHACRCRSISARWFHSRRFLPKPSSFNAAHRQHDVSMRVMRVEVVVADVSYHPLTDKLFLDILIGQGLLSGRGLALPVARSSLLSIAARPSAFQPALLRSKAKRDRLSSPAHPPATKSHSHRYRSCRCSHAPAQSADPSICSPDRYAAAAVALLPALRPITCIRILKIAILTRGSSPRGLGASPLRTVTK